MSSGDQRRAAVSGALLVALLAKAPPSRADDTARERDRLMGQRTAVVSTLGLWAAVSLAGGAVIVADPPGLPQVGPTRAYRRSFGVATLSFAVVNAILASVAAAGTARVRASLTRVPAVLHERETVGDLFAVNVGIDMLYVIAGALLHDRSTSDIVRGFGAGTMVQGGYLLGYDSTCAMIYRFGR